MAVAREHLGRGASVRVPMSYEEWFALGEAKHHEWSEGVLYVFTSTGVVYEGAWPRGGDGLRVRHSR